MSGRLDAAVLRWFNDLAGHGLFTTDTELRIQSWNRWLELQTGRSAREMLGQNLLDVWPELKQRGFAQYYVEALDGQVRVIAQALHGHLLSMRARRGNSAVPHMPQTARIAPLTEDGQVVGTITVIEDVSERTVREAELRNQIEALDDARRKAEAALRAKDEFLATLSHELRTPLNAVLGWTRILRSQGLGYHDAPRALQIIERNTNAQVRLIDDLLDMSRILSGKLRLDIRPVDISTVVAASVDVIAPSAAVKGVELRMRLEPNVPKGAGDADRLQQIVWNLLSNAVKFTPPGGTIDVRLQRDGDDAVISVRDSGEGIAPEFLPHVFERFRQADASTSRRHGGLGLGLALVRQLVELHGGTTAAASDGLGKGSTFSVRLPLLAMVGEVARAAAADATDDDPVRPLQNYTILAVDDDPDSLEMMDLLLSGLGASVMVARSCDDALTIMTDPQRPRPHVIVSDVAMPGEDGYTLMQRLRTHPETSVIPAVALTAYASADDRERAYAAGFRAYLKKPVDMDALLATIIALVNHVPLSAAH
jgi:PAS domain S-box-containing protein